MESNIEDELERLKKLNGIYLRIINRYGEHIENEESISVAELPRLVTPKDQSVMKKAEEIMNGFSPYEYNRDFYSASVIAYEYVRDNIDQIVLPIEFWLEPSETMEFGAGEKLDRYTLLCSILIALGNPSAKILIVEKAERLEPSLYYEFEGSIYVMNFGKNISRIKDREELLRSEGITEDAVAYEFNDKMYIDIV